MIKVMLSIVMMSVVVFGVDLNSNGWNDKDTVTGVVGSDTTTYNYSRAFGLSQGNDIRVLLKMNDTTTAGLGSDSLAVWWGFQTGTVTNNSSNAKDTVWDDLITCDTVTTLGNATLGTVGAGGGVTRTLGRVDTSSVTGYAIQSSWFLAEWDELIRYWVRARSGQSMTSSPMIVEQHKRPRNGMMRQ